MSQTYRSLNSRREAERMAHSKTPTPLSELLKVWELLDEKLTPLHHKYALKAHPIMLPKEKPQPIQTTDQYTAISGTSLRGSPSIDQDEHISSSTQNLRPEVSSVERSMMSDQREQDFYSVDRDTMSQASSATNHSSIWSREGFTPASRLDEYSIPETSLSSRLQSAMGIDKASSDQSVPQSPSHHLQPLKELTELSTAAENESQNRSQLMTDELIDVSASDAEIEEFTSVAERLMQAQERSLDRGRPVLDSSRPEPLEEFYEAVTPPLSSVVNTSRVFRERYQDDGYTSSVQPRLTPLHIVKVPEPLATQRKVSWGKMVIVSLISLMIGGVIAHFLLPYVIHLSDLRSP